MEEGSPVHFHRSNMPLLESKTCAWATWGLYGLLILIRVIKVWFSYNYSDKIVMVLLMVCLAFDVSFYAFLPNDLNLYIALFRLAFMIVYK